jgi:hypothetical protein
MASVPVASAIVAPRSALPARERSVAEAAGSDRPSGTPRLRKKVVDVASTLATSFFLFAINAV